MKFVIATVHPAYAFPFSSDGKDVVKEFTNKDKNISVASLNWLKPVENYNNNVEILLNNEIEGLENVDTSLEYYFKEQFFEDEKILLWMPSFYLNYLFYKDCMNKSIFEVDNLLSHLKRKAVITELEVIVFHLGKQSLKAFSYEDPKNINEKFKENLTISDYELKEGSVLFDVLVKNYSLSKYMIDDIHSKNWKHLHESSNDAFYKYGKLLKPQ